MAASHLRFHDLRPMAMRVASSTMPAMNVLLILNDPPYGTERSYNGLRLALALAKTDATVVRVFLMSDAIGCAKPGQTTPEGYYNIGRMTPTLG